MKAIRRFCQRLAGCLAGRRRDSDLMRELESHIQLMTDDLVRRGHTPEEARRMARVAFGGVESAREQCRDQRGLPSVDALRRDLRAVVRSFVRTPALAVLVVLTLGLAVGVNAAIFSLIDRVALRPLPVEKPDELVLINTPSLPYWGQTFKVGGRKLAGADYPLIKALREGTSSVFSAMAVYRRWQFALSLDAGAVNVLGEFVNHDYFRVYSLRALFGRTLAASEDERPGDVPVVVLNHAFWVQQFGGDRSILNRTIRLNKIAVTVVGVLGPGYSGTDPARVPQIFLPLATADQLTPFKRGRELLPWDSPALRLYAPVGRLRTGVQIEHAERALQARYKVLLDDAIAKGARLTPEVREYFATTKPVLFPAGTVGSLETATTTTLDLPLRLLLGMTALVLIVAAGNVATALLARNAARSHEVAVNYALGARRWHLLRPLLLESLLLASASAAVGLVLSAWAGSLVPTLLGLGSELAGVSTAPDRRVVVFTFSVSTGVALLIWIASAFAATRQGGRADVALIGSSHGGSRFTRALRRSLVVAQIALSLALLCTSVLFARSLLNVLSVDPGFDTRSLVAFSVNLGSAGLQGAERQRFMDRLVDEVASVPGVTRAAASSVMPLTGGMSGSYLDGPRQAVGQTPAQVADVVTVGPGFFATMGLTVGEGRPITDRDVSGAPRVAVVNEALARLLVEGESAVGQRIGFQHMARDITIVGVVRDIRTRSLRAAAEPTMFVPMAQAEGRDSMHVLARTAVGGALRPDAVAAMVRRLDPAVAVTDVRSVTQLARSLLLRERMLAGFSILFAALSAIVAAMGLVGVASHAVASRAREIAVRMALGASRARIQGMVFGEVGVLALAGGGLGLGLFLAANRVVESLLFGLSADDPVAIAGAVFVLATVVVLSCARPARRAARLDPAMTLRAE